MNSKERHEARYQRRVKRRRAKKNDKLLKLGGYDDVFSYEKLYDSFYLCRKGVRWKGSIQSYEATLPLSTLFIFNLMKSRKFKPMGFLEFDIMERGKLRHIRAVKIGERCIQRSLCDNYLSPLLESKLIYDNGASIKGKGIDFTLRRLKCHLSRYYRKYHTNEGYVLQYDFHSYFDNIDHEILLEKLDKLIPDKDIFSVVEKMIRCFGEKGLGLGSQVSQIAAIFYPTILDRVIKEELKVKGYCRYMDDGILICHTLEEVEKCKKRLFEVCKELNITINEKKLNVSKLSKTFVFLKKRIRMTETGKIVMRIGRAAVIRARRRLKKLAKKAYNPEEKFTIPNLYQCYKCWYGEAKRFMNYYILQNYRKLYLSLIAKYEQEESVERRDRSCWTYVPSEESLPLSA